MFAFRFISLNPYNSISNLEIWNHEEKKTKKGKQFYIDLAYIADVSVLTNPVIWKHCLKVIILNEIFCGDNLYIM